jgi:hypothetical protein
MSFAQRRRLRRVSLCNLISSVSVFSHSTFDVGRSMFDVHFFIFAGGKM